MLNKITLGYAKSIALPTKVINLSLSAHPGSQRAISFFFYLGFTREREPRIAQLLRATRTSSTSRVSSYFSRFPLFFSLPRRSRGPTRAERWAGSIDGLRDDSVQRGVRNFHARTSRRAGQAAPAAHTGETHKSGSLLVATTGGI